MSFKSLRISDGYFPATLFNLNISKGFFYEIYISFKERYFSE